jgi:hypothetical protein
VREENPKVRGVGESGVSWTRSQESEKKRIENSLEKSEPTGEQLK